MKRLLAGIALWLAKTWKEENNCPPYPFDDEEGEKMWAAGKREADNQKAVEKQVKEWQRWATRQGSKKAPSSEGAAD
jgi:MoxR-like ATPase